MTQKKISGILLLLTMIVLLAVSCSKKLEQVQPRTEPMPASGKLSKLEYKGGYDSLYYNTDGSIHKIATYYSQPGPYTEVFTFEYNADKKLSKISSNLQEHYEYVYFGGQLTAVKHYVNGTKKDYRIYDYKDGKLSSVEEYYQISSAIQFDLIAQRDFTYYPDGNLKEEINFSFDPQTHVPVRDFTVVHSDYDNKANPAAHLSRFLYLSFIEMEKNNARKMTAKNEFTGAFTQFNYEYTYDATARPATRKTSYVSGGQHITENIIYHYYQ